MTDRTTTDPSEPLQGSGFPDSTPPRYPWASSGSTATAVADRPVPSAPTSADRGAVPPTGRGWTDRVRDAPRTAKVAAGGTAAVVLLVGAGVGGFAVGHATADPVATTGTDGQVVPGQAPGGFPGGDGQVPFPPGGPGGAAPDTGTDSGTDPGTDTGSDPSAGTTWYVVPSAPGLLTT